MYYDDHSIYKSALTCHYTVIMTFSTCVKNEMTISCSSILICFNERYIDLINFKCSACSVFWNKLVVRQILANLKSHIDIKQKKPQELTDIVAHTPPPPHHLAAFPNDTPPHPVKHTSPPTTSSQITQALAMTS